MSDRPCAEELVSLGERIAEQAVHLDAAMHRLLADLRRFDEAGGWYAQGFASCAHWLSHRVGWDLGTARERVRVARALAGLPRVDAALAAGQLSYSKARAVTRVATPVTEPTLLQYAEVCTASQLETLCRKFHAAERVEANPRAALPREDDRYVVVSETASGMVCVKAFLRADEAALLIQAIQRAAGDCVSEAAQAAAGREEDAGVGVGIAVDGRAGSEGVDGAPSDADGGTGSGGRGAPAEISAGGAALAVAEISAGGAAPAVGAGSPAASAGLSAARPARSLHRADGLMALAQAYARGQSAQRSPIELIVTTSAGMLRPQDRKTGDPSLASSPAPEERGVPAGSPSQDASCAGPTDRGASVLATASGGPAGSPSQDASCAGHTDRGASVSATAVAESDLYLSPEATRRLACDCGLVEATVKGRWGRLDAGEAVGRLFRVKQGAGGAPPAGTTSSHMTSVAGLSPSAGPRAARRGALAPTPPVAEDAEDAENWEDDSAQIAHDFWAGGERGAELLEWALAELAATGIDPMAQVPAPYCAPAGWRSSRSQPPTAPPAGRAGD